MSGCLLQSLAGNVGGRRQWEITGYMNEPLNMRNRHLGIHILYVVFFGNKSSIFRCEKKERFAVLA